MQPGKNHFVRCFSRSYPNSHGRVIWVAVSLIEMDHISNLTLKGDSQIRVPEVLDLD